MRYKATVSYDGTNYSGWQIQNDKPSIQECLNKALSKITSQDIKVTGSGRTDGFVHAKGQVFHFDTDKVFKDIQTSINSQLPNDIFVTSVEKVDDEFHARFSAKWKHYDYLICDDQYDPTKRNYVVFTNKLNVEKMQETAQVLLGKHDFTTFNATKKEEIEDQVRTIYKIDIQKENGLIRISYFGDGFLRYMVRILSQVLILVGQGKLTKEEVTSMLNACNKEACPYNGQPQGLYLMEVGYEPYQVH